MNQEKPCYICKEKIRMKNHSYCIECERERVRKKYNKTRKELKCVNCKKVLEQKKKKYCDMYCNISHNSKKDKNGCIIWTSYVNSRGGVTISLIENGKRINKSAARFMYEEKNGRILKEEYLIHKCGNILCINPNHMSIVGKENFMKYVTSIRTHTDGRGHKIADARIKPKAIEKILEMSKKGYNSDEIAELYNKYYKEHFQMVNVEDHFNKHPPMLDIINECEIISLMKK